MYRSLHVVYPDPFFQVSKAFPVPLQVLHVLSLPWKLIFALVPPTEYCGGWSSPQLDLDDDLWGQKQGCYQWEIFRIQLMEVITVAYFWPYFAGILPRSMDWFKGKSTGTPHI